MYIILILMLLRSGFCDSPQFPAGSDASLRCDVSRLSESSTLQWEKDGGQTSNTTLTYDNSAYIILHNVDEHSGGKYYCKLRKDGGEEIVSSHTLKVKSYSYTENDKNNKNPTIYRQSSNNSDVSLICKSSRRSYERWKWTWVPRPNSQIDLMAVEKGQDVQVKGPIQPGRLSSTTYNSQAFNFHISPVNFNYSGTYKCITETTVYTTVILRTIRVSVAPPGDDLRNQSVVLTCEVSEVTDPVTLVWLRMEGNRGVLEKQQNMTKTNKMLQLTVNLISNKPESLHWQCAVFTGNELRALGPVTITQTSSSTYVAGVSIENVTVTKQENMDVKDSRLQIIIMAFAVSVSVLILLGCLVFKCQRNTGAGVNSQEEENIHYASVTVARSSQGADRFETNHSSSEVLDRNSAVIYSTVRTQ